MNEPNIPDSPMARPAVGCSAGLERAAVLKAIADEPEYPGDCPPMLMGYIRQAIQDKDEDAILYMMRQTVRLTKECITERVILRDLDAEQPCPRCHRRTLRWHPPVPGYAEFLSEKQLTTTTDSDKVTTANRKPI